MSNPHDPRDDTVPAADLASDCPRCRSLSHPWRVGDDTAVTNSGEAAPVDGAAWE
jgi:hypothetical protein